MSKSTEEILEESKAAMRLYFNSEKDRLKLIGVRYATKILSLGLKLLILTSVIVVAVIFVLVALALVWGSYLDNYPLAMLYIGLCVLGVGFILYLVRKPLITSPILRVVLKVVFKEDNEEI